MLDKVLRTVILVSAGVAVVCRYVAFRGTETMAEQTVKLLNELSFVGLGVLAVCGLIFAILLKKEEKEKRAREVPDGGETELVEKTESAAEASVAEEVRKDAETNGSNGKKNM